MTDVPIVDLDHLLCRVEDTETAGETYRRLGFTVTPRSAIEAMGVANRLILLDPSVEGCANFIECMAVTDAARLPPAMAGLLHGSSGVASLVFVAEDAYSARAALLARGLAPGPVHSVHRQWRLPDGEELDVAFDVLLPLEAPLTFNVCRYRTLQHYLRPAWRRHANTARRMLAALAVVPDPDATASWFADALAASPIPWRGGIAVSPGATQLVLYDHASYAERFGAPARQGVTGILIGVEDLATCQAAIGPARATPDGLLVQAEGNDLIFTEATS